MTNHIELSQNIVCEIAAVLNEVDAKEIEALVNELMQAEKVFIFGVGRVFLSLKCLGKRLGHLDIDVQVVGAVNEKPIGAKDLLLIGSGSGESKLPAEIARIAKSKGARLGLITASRSSTIKSMSDVVVHLPAPTKFDAAAGIPSVQPMTNLFDQALHIFGDVVSTIIQQRKGITSEQLWRYHANLE